MKNKKIIVIVSLLVILIAGGVFIAFRSNASKLKVDNSKTKESIEQLKEELPLEEETKQDEEVSKEPEETGETQEALTEKKETVTDSKSNESSNVESSTPKKETTTNSNSNQSSTTPQQPEVKEETAWEKLGITEYEYYNTPELEWQTVDIDINDYASVEEAANACDILAQQNAPMENYSYQCSQVYSYSWKLLGYHIQYFQVKER